MTSWKRAGRDGSPTPSKSTQRQRSTDDYSRKEKSRGTATKHGNLQPQCSPPQASSSPFQLHHSHRPTLPHSSPPPVLPKTARKKNAPPKNRTLELSRASVPEPRPRIKPPVVQSTQLGKRSAAQHSVAHLRLFQHPPAAVGSVGSRQVRLEVRAAGHPAVSSRPCWLCSLGAVRPLAATRVANPTAWFARSPGVQRPTSDTQTARHLCASASGPKTHVRNREKGVCSGTVSVAMG